MTTSNSTAVSSLFYSVVDWLLDVLTPQILLGLIVWWVGFLCVWYLLGFGIVYCCATLIYLMFTNLGKRRKGELSAYSAFNVNGSQIAGTFGAAFYENMLRRGGQLQGNVTPHVAVSGTDGDDDHAAHAQASGRHRKEKKEKKGKKGRKSKSKSKQ